MYKPWREWDLNQWLNSLENRNAQEVELGLERTMEVALRLDLQTPKCKIITVAGTNGKGSTVSALETIYHVAGYKVGSYTSPHLIYFNERIRSNLNSIVDEDLCHAFCVIEEVREKIHLTYFEMTTLAALWYFKQQKLDILILEVGLGGRLDATNIIDADVSIITTIDFDHQDFLGTTLESIGYEKAGILRKNKPFIYADTSPPASILSVAKNLSSPQYVYGRDYSFRNNGDSWDVNFRGRFICDLSIPKIQLKSAAAALVASLILDTDLPIGIDIISKAMNDVFTPGRLQLKKDSISILYDVSHNPQSVRLLAETIKNMNLKAKVHAVFSALKDKDLLGLIFPLKDCVDRWYPAQLENKRAASAELLLTQFKNAEIFVEVCYTSPLLAFKSAVKRAEVGDLIVVYGSFFTVGHVMAAQHNILEQKEIL